MPRFSGDIGFSIEQYESSPGIWIDRMEVRHMTGEILSFIRSNQNDNNINDTLRLNNKFSIIADAFTLNNIMNIRYITYMGVKWKITNVDVQRPRLILTVGGIWADEN